jgi:hypothetical protein
VRWLLAGLVTAAVLWPGTAGAGKQCGAPEISVEIRGAQQRELLESGRMRVRLSFCYGQAIGKLRAAARDADGGETIGKRREVVIRPRPRTVSIPLTRRGERLVGRCTTADLVVRASAVFEGDILVAGSDRTPLVLDEDSCAPPPPDPTK